MKNKTHNKENYNLLKFAGLLTATLLLLIFVACERRKLNEPPSDITVHFNKLTVQIDGFTNATIKSSKLIVGGFDNDDGEQKIIGDLPQNDDSIICFNNLNLSENKQFAKFLIEVLEDDKIEAKYMMDITPLLFTTIKNQTPLYKLSKYNEVKTCEISIKESDLSEVVNFDIFIEPFEEVVIEICL